MQREAVSSPSVLIRDVLIFQLKLLLDGLKDVVLFQASIIAALVDLVLLRRGPATRFYAVLRLSERFDLWLNLNGAAQAAAGSEDGLFGASVAGSDTLLGKLEELGARKSRRRRTRPGRAPRRRGPERATAPWWRNRA